MTARISILLPILLAFILAPTVAARAAKPPSPGHSSVTGKAVVDTSARKHVEGRDGIFVSWGAPFGMPGARSSATWACDDTLAADTLYLTFDPGQDINALMGIDVTLLFHAAPGDTLGPFWQLARSGANPWNLRIEFEPPTDGTISPWPVPGVGVPRYTLKGDSSRLDLGYFVPADEAKPIAAGTRYFFARVMLRMRRAWLSGCLQPVCVVFDHMLVSHSEGSRWINSGERFASWNSPGGAVCKEFRLRPPPEEPVRFGGRYDLTAPPEVPSPASRDTTRR